MDVSVIITSWNAKGLLEKCLDALHSHETKCSTEVIVVDNASSDGSPEMVKEEFPDVRLIQNSENLGFSKANNIGIRQSSGRYLFIINSDIFILPECVDRIVEFMDRNPEIGMLGPKMFNLDMTPRTNCKTFPTLWNNLCAALNLYKVFPKSNRFAGRHMRNFSYNTISRIEVISGAFWAIKKDALEKVGLLDEDFFFYGEDLDWCKRFWDAGWEVVFLPEAHAIHHHAGSTSNVPVWSYIQRHKAMMQFWKKHHNRFEVFGIRIIMLFRQLTRVIADSFFLLGSRNNRKGILFKIKRNLRCALWLMNINRKKMEQKGR